MVQLKIGARNDQGWTEEFTLEIEHEDNVEMEMVRYMEEPQEVITIIKRYGKILKKQNKKIISIMGKQE